MQTVEDDGSGRGQQCRRNLVGRGRVDHSVHHLGGEAGMIGDPVGNDRVHDDSENRDHQRLPQGTRQGIETGGGTHITGRYHALGGDRRSGDGQAETEPHDGRYDQERPIGGCHGKENVAYARGQDEGQGDVGGPMRRVVHGQGPGQVGAQKPEDGGGGHDKAAHGRVESHDGLHPNRHIGVEAHQEPGNQKHADVLDDEGPVAEEPQGKNGVCLVVLKTQEDNKDDHSGKAQEGRSQDALVGAQALQAQT